MKKIFFIFFGFINVLLAIIGIFVPGFPTTVFLLAAMWFFYRGSDGWYNWLINHKIFGVYINDYEKHKSMKLSTKIYAMSMMSASICLSTYFVIYPRFGHWGLMGMTLMFFLGNSSVLRVPTRKIN